jgi:hypothetical protein
MSLAHGRVEARLPAKDLGHYGIPGLARSNNIVDIPDNYPSKGRAERGAWFQDSEGNMLRIGQAIK